MAGLQAGMATATGLLNVFKNSVGNLAFGMQNMGTAGTVGMDAIKQGVVGMGSVFLGLAAIVAVAATAVAVWLGVKAVKAAGDFQQSITKLFTTAGELHSNLQMVGDGMLTMAGQVGTGAQLLSNAMYYIASGGYHGAAGLEALRVAAMGAKAENADLNGVAKVEVFTMNAYAAQHMSAATAMNTLIATTSRGVMTLAQLSGAVSNVLPAAAHFGISLTDVGAALATMTSQGDNASMAATHLRQLILALESPTKAGAAALKAIGLTTQQVADEMKVSLPGALQMIIDDVGKKFPVGSAAYNQAIRDIAGGSKQMMGFLELTGAHLKTFQGNVDAITESVKKAGGSILGWSDVQANFNFKMDAARAAFGALLIVLGQQLLPVFTQLVGQVAPLVTAFTSWLISSGALKNTVMLLGAALSGMITGVSAIVGFFQRFELASALLKATLLVLAVIIGGAMVMALYSYAAAAYVAAAANIAAFWPVYLVVIAVIAVVALVILAVQHWGEIAHWLQGAWGATLNWFHTVFGAIGAWFNALWNGIKADAVTAWNATINGIRNVVQGGIAWLQNAWNTCVQAVANAFLWLYNHNYYFRDLVNTIISVTTGVINWLHNAWTAVVSWISQKWQSMVGLAQAAWNGVRGVFAAVWGWMSGIFSQIGSGIASWWNAMTSTVRNLAVTLWQNVSSVFSSAWGYVSGPLGALAGSIGSFFSGLAGLAYSWGASIIQGVVNGIYSMLGAVASAAQSVVNTVASWLGFHSPTKEGPGRYLMDWGPGLAGGFAEGIVAGIPKVQTAVDMMVQPIPQKLGSVAASTSSGATTRSTGGGNREIVDALGRIERKMSSGGRITSDDIMNAFGRQIMTSTGSTGGLG